MLLGICHNYSYWALLGKGWRRYGNRVYNSVDCTLLSEVETKNRANTVRSSSSCLELTVGTRNTVTMVPASFCRQHCNSKN